jgi:hypothetical protein
MTAAVEDNRFCVQSRTLGDMASDSGADGFEQVSEGHTTTKRDGLGRHSPRTGTSISTILLQTPSTPFNIENDNKSATPFGNDSSQASSGDIGPC